MSCLRLTLAGCDAGFQRFDGPFQPPRYNEWEGLAATRASPTLSRDWLMQMGAGAAKQNVGVQYCMGLARMVMQSVEIPAVTTFRYDKFRHFFPFMLATLSWMCVGI